MQTNYSKQSKPMTPEQIATSEALDLAIAKHGSLTEWLNWRRKNEPGFKETVEYNPPLN